MLSDDPVAAAVDALFTDEVEERLRAALGDTGPRCERRELTAVHSVMRLYGSTAGPFGGIGGAAMTTFRLTVIYSPDLAVLFAGGRLYGFARPSGVDLGLLNPDEFTRIF